MTSTETNTAGAGTGATAPADDSTTDAVNELSMLAQRLQQELMAGGTLGELLELPDVKMEALYCHGYRLYKQGSFKEALHAFAFLIMHNQYEPRYYGGYGACLQMMQQPADALKYHGMASLLRASDPLPVFHSAQCYLALARTQEALQALELVKDLAAGDPGHAALGERAAAVIQLLTSTVQSSNDEETDNARL